MQLSSAEQRGSSGGIRGSAEAEPRVPGGHGRVRVRREDGAPGAEAGDAVQGHLRGRRVPQINGN